MRRQFSNGRIPSRAFGVFNRWKPNVLVRSMHRCTNVLVYWSNYFFTSMNTSFYSSKSFGNCWINPKLRSMCRREERMKHRCFFEEISSGSGEENVVSIDNQNFVSNDEEEGRQIAALFFFKNSLQIDSAEISWRHRTWRSHDYRLDRSDGCNSGSVAQSLWSSNQIIHSGEELCRILRSITIGRTSGIDLSTLSIHSQSTGLTKNVSDRRYLLLLPSSLVIFPNIPKLKI